MTHGPLERSSRGPPFTSRRNREGPIAGGSLLRLLGNARIALQALLAAVAMLLLLGGRTMGNAQTDTTSPSVQSAAVAANGLTLTIAFNEALAEASVPANSAFTVKATRMGSSESTFALASPGGVTVSGDEVILKLDQPIAHDDVSVKVLYDKPASGSVLEDAAGNDAVGFTDTPVTNNSTIPRVWQERQAIVNIVDDDALEVPPGDLPPEVAQEPPSEVAQEPPGEVGQEPPGEEPQGEVAQEPAGEDSDGKEQVEPLAGERTPVVSEKLDGALNQLVHDHRGGAQAETGVEGALGNVAPGGGLGRGPSPSFSSPGLASTVAVEVFFEETQRQSVVRYMRSNGANVREPLDHEDSLVANVAASLLAALVEQPGVLGVKVANEPVLLGAGARSHGASSWHGAGFRGAGVRVGVIDLGYRDYSRHIGSELPAPSGVLCYTRNVNVQHRTMAACETASSHGHGTNVTEMIYDVAPDAEYYIAGLVYSRDMSGIIDWFNSNDVDVVVMSLGADFEGPGDGTTAYTGGYMGGLQRAVRSGMVVATSAGNRNFRSWFGRLVDTDNDDILEWTDGDECNRMELEGGRRYEVAIRWDDTWRGATTNLDLEVRRGGAFATQSRNPQSGGSTHDPQEVIEFTAPRDGSYCITIEKRSGSIPAWTQLLVNGGTVRDLRLEHQSDGYSITSPAELIAPGLLAVGAARHDSTGDIESYSSRGPLPSGAIKPDIVGAANVYSVTGGGNLIGTSIAAPHVGGLAALVKERFPWYTPAEIATFLKNGAARRGDPIPNNVWGWGYAWFGGTPASGTVSISGRLEVDRTLTATSNVTDADGLRASALRWQWYRIDGRTRTPIPGATSRGAATSTYTIVAADEGKALAARLEFADRKGHHEEVFSASTAIVVGAPSTLVSNIGHRGGRNHITLIAGRQVAQPFYTGQDALGYNLRQVRIHVAQALPEDATYTVAIYNDAAGNRGPDRQVVQLIGDLTSSGQQIFDPASPTVLKRETAYYVVITVASLGGTPPLVNAYVDYKWPDFAIKAPGWQLWNLSYYKSRGDTAWTHYDVDWGFSVRGDPIPADNTVSFSHRNYSVREGQTTNLRLELARPAAGPFTVPVVVGDLGQVDAADYSGIPANVSFATGDTSKTFPLTAVQDTEDDDNEFIHVALGTMPAGIVSVNPIIAFVRIIDDDVPGVTVAFDAISYDVDEGDEVEVTVRLSALAERQVVIPLKVYDREAASADSSFSGNLDSYASSATDYSGVPATLTFTSDDTEQTFSFRATEEMLNDDGEQVVLSFGTLPSQVSADSTVHSGESGPRTSATISLRDNDVPDVTVRFGAATYSVAEGQTIHVPVELSEPPERAVVIPFETTARGGVSSSDYILVPTSVTFAADEARKTLSFTAISDSEASEAGEGVRLAFGTMLPDGVTVDTTVPPGETSARNTATVSITDMASRPGPPSIRTVTGRFRQLIVAWTAPAATGGADVIRYQLRHILSSASSSEKADPANWTRLNNVWQTDGGDLTYTLRGLQNGTSYDLQVAATNSIGTSVWSATRTGAPVISNQAPAFPASETGARAVREDAAVGASIGAPVRATDADSSTLRYALETAHDLISIDERTGQLRVKALLDFETATQHTVTVTVSDLANPDRVANEVVDDEIEVTITVRSFNEPPEVTGDAAIVVTENTTGTLATYQASDPEGEDIAEWSLAGTDAADFTIDSNGALSFASPPDFDAPADANGNNVYQVRVRAKDQRKVGRFNVVVTVTNVEEAPVITGDSSIDFAENGSMAVGSYSAKDPEGLSTHWRTLSGDDAALFVLPADGALRFLNPPDFESAADSGMDNTYEVTLTAADHETDGLTSTLDVTVRVTEVDEPPLISGASVANFLEEGTGAVETYTVADPEGVNTSFTWALEGPDRSLFSLTADGTSATLAFATPPDFETPADSGRNNEYDVTIRVTADDKTVGRRRVLVTVTNMNDAPTLTGGPTTITVAEDVTGTIGTYTASDPERAAIQWSVTGTDAADFTINAMGQLSFANGADFETQTSHSITVVASDGEATTALTASRAVTVTVTGVDEPPAISPAADIEVDENTTSAFATFTASDPEGVRTSFTFSLAGTDAGDFTLTSGGALTFTKAPDYEKPADGNTDNEYLITIRANDGDMTGELDLTVTVGDVNEPPAIAPTGNITWTENSTGTVADYDAADPEGVTDTFTWSLTGDDADDFTLHTESGSLTFVNTPDYDAPADADQDNVYELTINVTDDDLTNAIDVEVTVTNINEPPVIAGDPAITRAEDSVGALATYTATDPEGITTFAWSLSGADRDDFTIGASTGVLSFAAEPDFDNPTDANRDNVYSFAIRASDGTNTATYPVTVTVSNTDEPPVVTGPAAVTDYPENSPTTRVVGRYRARDPEGRSVTWSPLGGRDAASFALSAGGVLTFTDSPDHEVQDEYTVLLTASDGTKTTSLEVTVTITDVNEAPVVARQTGTGAFRVVENSGRVVGTFVATDPEEDSVDWSVGGTDAGDFEISDSGTLSFRANPDHDTPLDSGRDNTYSITVKATEEDDSDAATTELSGSLAVTVRVTGVDEAPVITGPTAVASYAENSTARVGRYSASDPEGNTWTWSDLSGADATDFELSAAGALTFENPPNFESQSSYTVTLNAWDGANTGSLTVSVTVVDVDEVPAVSRSSGSGAFSVEENSGTVVGSFTASDPESERVTWSLAGTDSGDFAINGSGALTFKETPDYDAPLDSGRDNTYNVTVRATEEDDSDPATTELTGGLAVIVKVTNVDEAPVITPPATVSTGSIDHAENRTNNTVATFTASDPERRPVLWQSLGGDDAADFNFSNGRLSFPTPPNFEDAQDDGADNTYNVTIRASDGTNTGIYDLTVRVTNVDEAGTLTPSSTQPQSGTALTATLTDPDVARATTWKWERSTSRARGWATIATATSDSYTPVDGDVDYYLRVTASYTDGHGSGKTRSFTWSNRVQSRPPENIAPDFGDATATRSVNENSAANTNVGAAVTATDAESPSDLTYTLSGSTLFAIVGTSGQIRVATGAALDHEADDEHTVTVTATDPGALSDTITVTIQVADVNEPPVAAPDTASTSEDTAITFGVLANDSDPETAPADLTVSIGSTRPANGTVTLNATTKEFTYTPNANFHGADSFTYVLSDGTNRVTGTVNVLVASVNDLPAFDAATATRTTAENAAVGARVGSALVARDRDHSSLTYALRGTSAFAINSTTGQITVATGLDHETTPSYTATVTARDGAGATATIEVTITVTNVNEAPTAGDDSVNVDEDMTAVIDVLQNDTDPDTLPANLRVSLVSSRVPRGTATVDNATQQITYTPNLNTNGLVTFDYRVTDDGNNRDVGTVRVNVRPLNDAPVFAQQLRSRGLRLTIREGAGPGDKVGTPVTANDPDSDALRYDLSDISDFAIDSVTGQLRVAAGVTIDRERIALYEGTVTASDAAAASDSIAIRIEVSNVPEPPIVADDAVKAVEDTPLTIHVLGNDMDPDTPPEGLTVRVLRQPSNGRAEAESDNTIIYTPNRDSTNRDSFEYQVSDGRNSDAGFVYITDVTAVNDAPAYRSGTVSFEVSEDSEPGEAVGYALTAFDVDDDDLTYSLSGSTAFEIDPQSAQITTATLLDATTTPTHTVTVTATDSASPPLEATIEVTITVVLGQASSTTPPPAPRGGAPPSGGGGPPIILPPGIAGGPSGPTPSERDFEWTVDHDIEALDSAHDSASGAWGAGSTLLVLQTGDGAEDAVYAYDLESGERREDGEFALAETNRAPRGIWSDGKTAWVSDSGQERLFAYNLETGEREEEREIVLARGNRDARGIWSDGVIMWVLSANPSLFAYNLEAGALLGEYELAEQNGSPHGIWSDGVTVWVSNHDPKRLFAYRLPVPAEAGPPEEPPALERVVDEDFDELSRVGNNSPRGIWSDEAVMYVADESDDKVYTYNMPDAIDARLISLTLSGVDIGAFDPGQTYYEGVIAEGGTEATVGAEALQRHADIVIDPPDTDGDDTNGHQVALPGVTEITITVMSPDRSRTRVYRVTFEPTAVELALRPMWTPFEWPGADGTAIDEAGLPEEVVAVYTWDEATGSWLGYFPGLGDVPGVNTLAALASGATHWVAAEEDVTWMIETEERGLP